MHYQSVLGQIAWPALLNQSASNRMAVLFQIEQSQWWTPHALREAQFEQLRQLIPYAAKNVPHYADALSQFTRPDAITPESWSQIPLLKRQDLAPGRKAMVSRQIPREHGSVETAQTSGSTGVAVEFMCTDLTSFFFKVFSLREHLWHRRDFSQKMMAIRFAAHARNGLQATDWGMSTEGVVRTGPAVLHHIQSDVSFLAERLLAERPGYLLAYPSVLAGLIAHCEQRGVKPQGLLEVRSIGETMPEGLRESCQRAWGVPVVDMYTCQEAGYLATQCPEHDHYHVQAENIYLEVIDANGNACQPGEVGRVVVTSLHNFATPLIRYEVGDCAEVGEPCPCGRGLPVLKRVLGRYRNLLTLPSGDTRWPMMGYEELRAVAPVDMMQMVQHSVDEIEVRLVAPAPLREAQRDALTRFIHGNLGHPFALRFEYVEDIRGSANGKVEQFISKLAPQPRG